VNSGVMDCGGEERGTAGRFSGHLITNVGCNPDSQTFGRVFFTVASEVKTFI
jgi:hypothetical protein